MTFADFAVTEVRFRKHFRKAPPDTWNENMVPLHEFLDLDEPSREGLFPFLWSVDQKQRLGRLLVDASMVASCQDRLDFWTMLRSLAGVDRVAEETGSEMEARVRSEVIAEITANLTRLAGGEGEGRSGVAPAASQASEVPVGQTAAPAAGGDYLAPWIDTEQCTSCDECIRLNPKIFAYDERKKATIRDPLGGPYQDLVRAAERCTAVVIHPGLPADREEKGIERWIARGEKFN